MQAGKFLWFEMRFTIDFYKQKRYNRGKYFLIQPSDFTQLFAAALHFLHIVFLYHS